MRNDAQTAEQAQFLAGNRPENAPMRNPFAEALAAKTATQTTVTLGPVPPVPERMVTITVREGVARRLRRLLFLAYTSNTITGLRDLVRGPLYTELYQPLADAGVESDFHDRHVTTSTGGCHDAK